MLLPESNVVPLAQLRANRYLYLPSIGVALWVAVGLDHWAESAAAGEWRQVAFRWAGFAVAAVFAVISYNSADVLRDDVSAWTRVVQRHPWSAAAQAMLGRAYYARHDDIRAERELKLALRFDRPSADAYLYLAKLYAAYGMTEPAGTHLHRYLELAPNDPEGRELLAAIKPSGDS